MSEYTVERECRYCDDVLYVNTDDELYCPQCAHTPSDSAPSRTETVGPWEKFRQRTDEYSGFYGDDRVKMIGGFISVWDFGEDGYL